MQTQYTSSLEPENYYHIYNRGNNDEALFYSNENYRYFLVKFDDYFDDLLTLHAFCLLKNHFHLLVEIKKQNEIKNNILVKERNIKLRKYVNESAEVILSKQFQYFFIGYAKALNKQTDRHGSLFEKPFRRKFIANDEYYRNVMYYIHRNLEHHGSSLDFRDYPWSSYSRILESKPSKLPKSQIMNVFENAETFTEFHSKDRNLEQYKEELIDY
jgi:putative transposase